MEKVQGGSTPSPEEPQAWLSSIDALAKVLRADNISLIQAIAAQQPESVSRLAGLIGRGEEELTRSLDELAEWGIVQLIHDGETFRPTLAVRHLHLNLLTNTYRLEAAPAYFGPFRDESAALAFLRDRLVASLRPKAVWLFGSRARGDARPDSDFDLLVVLPDGLPDAAYSHQAVAAPLVACGLPFDAVPCSWSDFTSDRTIAGSLVHRAVTEGRLLYEAQPRS
jgi:predicted transcriptional regulator/predicted nucleotidyltransferase